MKKFLPWIFWGLGLGSIINGSVIYYNAQGDIVKRGAASNALAAGAILIGIGILISQNK